MAASSPTTRCGRTRSSRPATKPETSRGPGRCTGATAACSSHGSRICAIRPGGPMAIRSPPRRSSSASPARAHGRTSTCSGPRSSTTIAATRSGRGRAATASACSLSSPRAWPPCCAEATTPEPASTRSDARRTTHRPVGELVARRRLAGRDDGLVVRRVPADGIGRRSVAGEAKRLAAAATPVLLLPPERARAARLLHPVRAAEVGERVGLVPDPVERAVAHVGELEARDRRRGLAWECLAVGRDDDRGAPPTAHAGLRQVLMDVGEDPEDRDPRADALAEAPHRLLPAVDLCLRRDERLLVDDRPPVVLRVRELQALGAELLGEHEDLLDPVEVLAVQDAVDRERKPELTRRARGRDLL